ncbi:MAG: hypothetical protein ACTSUE_24645 [Promethearchaeota archaeon]
MKPVTTMQIPARKPHPREQTKQATITTKQATSTCTPFEGDDDEDELEIKTTREI